MMEWTPGLAEALLGLLSLVLATGMAYLRKKGYISQAEGDKTWEVVNAQREIITKVLREKYPEKVDKANEYVDFLHKAWKDSKVNPPEYDDYVKQVAKVIRELDLEDEEEGG